MSKKLALITGSIGYLLSFSKAFAADQIIRVNPPDKVGYTDIGVFISNVLTLIFSLATIVVLLMLVWGAFEWITSGGDKEAVGKARNKILNALIGLAVLAVAFAVAKLAANFLGFDFLQIRIPSPQ